MKPNLLHSLTVATGLAAGLLTASTVQAGTFQADFSQLGSGQSVEGLGAVHELLNISSSTGGGQAIVEGGGAGAYGASSSQTKANSNIRNGGIGELGGFADLGGREHKFEFSFAEGTAVNAFSLRMLDYGDYNKARAANHSIFLTAFNSQGEIVDRDVLSYQSSRATNPLGFYQKDRTTGEMGRGDALMAEAGDAGLKTFAVSGEDIVRVVLGYEHDGRSRASDIASDPNIGFDSLTFETADDTADVPEPASLLGLLAVGVLGAGTLRKR